MRIRHLAVIVALAAVAAPAPAPAAVPGPTPIKCVLADPQTRCSYFASGPGRLDALRAGPWVVRIYRRTELVWTLGAQSPATIRYPSQPGDLVQAQIITGGFCPSPPQDLPEIPQCNGAGPIILSEGLPFPL